MLVVNGKEEGVSFNSHTMKKRKIFLPEAQNFSSEKVHSTIRPKLLPKAEYQAPGFIKALYGTSLFFLIR